MNEPNSIIGDLLQFSLLAGKKQVRQHDHSWADEFAVKPQDFKHLIMADSFVYDGTTDTSFFGFEIPDNQCLLVNYVSMYTSEEGGISAPVNYGINVDVLARWEVLNNGMTNPVTPYLPSQAYVNSPCLFVFPASTIPTLTLLNFGGALTVPLFIQMRLNGYLLDASFQAIFKRFQTLPAAT